MQQSTPMAVMDLTGVDTPHQQMPSSGQRYEKLDRPLGEGTFGVVYKARDLLHDELVAMKKLPMNVWSEGMPATALREITVLKEVQHPNIVVLRDVFVSYNGNLYLVFELMDCDLKTIMDTCRRVNHTLPPALPRCAIPPHWCKWLLYQLLSGTSACHDHRIVHRDLKPQNILIDKATGVLKLADFGLARPYAVPLRPYTHEVVTLWYRCPEILLGQTTYNNAVDMWSAGCILAEMASGEPFFQGECEIDQLVKIFQKLGTPTKEVWSNMDSLPDYLPEFPKFRPHPWSKLVPLLEPAGVDLLNRLLSFDPVLRITARDALAHPYFADLQRPTTRLEDDLAECFARARAGAMAAASSASRVGRLQGV